MVKASCSENRETRKRILIVEDDAALVNVHRNLLSDQFALIISPSGMHACQFLKNRPDIDLALIDMRLPDISGIEVLRKIKEVMPCVPIIVVTAYGSESVAVKAFRYGARDYVKKPFRYAELLKRINFCLALNVTTQVIRRKALTCAPDGPAADSSDGVGACGRNVDLQRALRFIHDNYSADISLQRAADVATMSKFYFSRLFKKMTGLTYQQYVNAVRIDEAKKLLKNGVLTITATGYAVGYSDLTHFERTFKKHIGATPSQYRSRTASRPDAAEDMPHNR